MAFDTLYYDHIQGELDVPIVRDLGSIPNRVLEMDRDCEVELNWRLQSDAPMSHPVDLIDGTWVVKVSAESIGPGPEINLASTNVPFSSAVTSDSDLRTWQHIFTVPANTITQEAVYKLVTLITYRDPHGHRRAMAGFSEGPIVTFYQDQD
jgi:hypothetical protein